MSSSTSSIAQPVYSIEFGAYQQLLAVDLSGPNDVHAILHIHLQVKSKF
jgi:hypothetical protein